VTNEGDECAVWRMKAMSARRGAWRFGMKVRDKNNRLLRPKTGEMCLSASHHHGGRGAIGDNKIE
jgi:hypothetical protein